MNKKLFAVALAGALLLTGCSSTTDAPQDNTEDTQKNQQEQEQLKVGDTFNLSGVDVTVNGVTEATQSPIGTYAEGEKVYAIDLTMKNNSDKDKTFSSMMCASVINVDGYDCNQDIANTKKAIDGSLPVGIQKRGLIYYTSDADLQAITLQVDLGGDKQTIMLTGEENEN